VVVGLATVFNGRANPALKHRDILLGGGIDSFDLLPGSFCFGLEIFISFFFGLLLELDNLGSFRSIPAMQISQLIVQSFDHGSDRGRNVGSANVNRLGINSFGHAPDQIM